uniref:Uncharacterized protein n=1 Tax=Meloidogyne hapla TaxID=6305 RepID=A0A1I8B588_MELHA
MLLNLFRLYDLVIKHIKTSKDCSKMVRKIIFGGIRWPLVLSERAENIEKGKEEGIYYFTKYQISNMHNPKVRFSIYNWHYTNEDGTVR